MACFNGNVARPRYAGLLFATLIAAVITGTARADAPAVEDTIQLAGDQALTTDQMASSRAGTAFNSTNIAVTSNQTMNGTSTGNVVSAAGNLSNGAITVGSNLGGSGFGSYVMNTGNNALINSGVSLSVLMLGSGPTGL